MSLPTYCEYKDTGLDWLEIIPSHWELKRLKYLGDAIIGLTYTPDDVVDEHSGTLVLRSSNIQNKRLAFEDNVYVSKDIPEKLRTKSGDILICARNGSRALIGKNAQIDAETAGASFGAFMSIFRSKYNRFLSKVFNSTLFEFQSGSFLTSTINQLTTGNLNSFEVPFPPIEEQTQIANFLDRETAKIDTLIEKQKRLIKLLKEKRQAVISHAVTKGHNPNAKIKDSGVEWLGEVPEHWAVKRIKHCGKVNGGFAFKSGDFCDSGAKVLKISNIAHLSFDWSDQSFLPEKFLEEAKEWIPPPGSLIFAMTRPIISGGVKVAKLEETEPYLVNQRVGFMEPSNKIDQDYLMYVAQSKSFYCAFENNITATNQPNISSEGIEDIRFACPPIEEQRKLVKFITSTLTQYDKINVNAESMINLLKERRTALISAAVTGKIDVRHHASHPSGDLRSSKSSIHGDL